MSDMGNMSIRRRAMRPVKRICKKPGKMVFIDGKYFSGKKNTKFPFRKEEIT